MHSSGPAAASRDKAACGPIIMVADSDRSTALRIENILAPQGYTVIARQDPCAFWESETEETPDVVILDFDAGQRPSGPVRSGPADRPDAADVPVLYLTQSADEKTAQAVYGAGGCDYLIKPVRACEVLARVRTALDRRRADQAWRANRRLGAVLDAAGGVCHELNQPLQFIMGSIQLLLMDLCASEPLARKMKTLAERSEQMGDITRRLSQVLRDRDDR
jgi:DNA-binding response OmpR family regulator